MLKPTWTCEGRDTPRERLPHGMAAACLVLAGLLVLAGCMPPPYSGPPGPLGQISELPPVVQRYENPSLVANADPARVWETVVDVVDDYFRIENEDPVRVIGNTLTEGRLETYPLGGATLLEPWRKDAADGYERAEGTLQSVRRRALVKVTPAAAGYLVEINVFKELEDVPRPEHSTAGAATLQYESTLNRIVNPVGEQQTSRGWIPLGRDPALEQAMLANLETRVGRLVPPSSLPRGPAPGASCGAPRAEPVASTTRVRACTHHAEAGNAEAPGDLRHRLAQPIDDSIGLLVDLRDDFDGDGLGSLPSVYGRGSRAVSPVGRFGDLPLHWVVYRAQSEPMSRLPASDCLPPSETPAVEMSPAFSPALDSGTLPGDAAAAASCEPPRGPPLLVDYGRPRTWGGRLKQFGSDVVSDYGNFYSCQSLLVMGAALGTGAVLANTSIDGNFQNWYSNNVRTSGTNSVSNVVHYWGNGEYVIPGMAAVWLVSGFFDESLAGSAVNNWSQRSLRAYLVGAPAVLAFQYILGASRPYESSTGSHWNPFHDTNAVSGHAFIGAVPFLTAAKMCDNILWKAGMLTLSVLPAWSRVNDNSHYLSQVILGYTFACLSVCAVDLTERNKAEFHIVPMAFDNGVGIGLMRTF